MQKGNGSTPKQQGLTPKQKRFAEEYHFDGNARAAAIRAGYAPPAAHSQGSRLLKHVEIKAELARLAAQVTERITVTKEWLQSEIIKTIRSAEKNKKEGSALRGLELLARLNGQIIDQKAVRVVRSFSEMSDEELAALTQDAEARDRDADAVRH